MSKHNIKKCSYRGCTSSGKDFRYYKFPINSIQREEWKIASQCGNINLNSALICEKHFYPEDFSEVADVRSRLKFNTVPIGFRTNGIDETTNASDDSGAVTISNLTKAKQISTDVGSQHQRTPPFKVFNKRLEDSGPNVICEMIESPGPATNQESSEENDEIFYLPDSSFEDCDETEARPNPVLKPQKPVKPVVTYKVGKVALKRQAGCDIPEKVKSEISPSVRQKARNDVNILKRVKIMDPVDGRIHSPRTSVPGTTYKKIITKLKPKSQKIVVGTSSPNEPTLVTGNSTSPQKDFIYKIVNKKLVRCSVGGEAKISAAESARTVKEEAAEKRAVVPTEQTKILCCALCKGYPDFLPLPPKLFPFPRNNRELRLKWEALTQIPLAQWHPDLRICSVHFPSESFVRNEGMLELKPGALPSIIVQSQVKEEKCTIVPSCVIRDDLPKRQCPVVNTRCAVCCINVLTNEAVPIFNEKRQFTEFGVALATILKATSQPLNYTHCCESCSGHVVSCYSAIMDINAAAQVTMKRDFLGILPCPEACGGSAALNEPCPKCHSVCFSFKDYVSHTMQHMYESKRQWVQYKEKQGNSRVKAVSIGTQVDDIELDMAFDEQAMSTLFAGGSASPPSRKKRKQKPIYEAEIKVEALDAVQIKQEKDLQNDDVGWPDVALDEESSQTQSPMPQTVVIPDETVAPEPDDDELFVCHICGKSFETKKKCRIHISRHNSEKNLNISRCCHICGRNVKQKYWWMHQRYHRDPCKVCGKRVLYMQQHMQLHKKSDIAVLGNECNECGKAFEQRGLLRVHMFLKHGANPTSFARGRSFGEKWSCQLCGDVFESYKAIRHHSRTEHNSKGIDMPCEECGKIYNNLQSLSTHALSAHSNYYSMKCKHCGNLFVSEEKYNNHLSSTCRILYGRGSKQRQRTVLPENTEEIQYAVDTIVQEDENKYGSAIFVDSIDVSDRLEENEGDDAEDPDIIYEELEEVEQPDSTRSWQFVHQSSS